jgi:heptosyltransferase-2
LLGGPQERERNREILEQAGGAAIDGGTDNSLLRFAALVKGCDVILSGDTTCMHLAIALKKRTVIFFGATCSQEIDLYNRGEKIVATIPCSPCYLKAGTCPINEQCMEEISVDEVLTALKRQLELSQRSS